ncbi:hypothetical protein GOBAR_DD27493 [Gossypium barbadense]|nr:hypothetical protein GOBAR_DD27493 [Gossypium barbadense]
MGDKISLGEDMLRIDIIDQSFDLDGQVEKRLDDMVAIPILTHWLEAALIRHKHIGRRMVEIMSSSNHFTVHKKNVMGRVKAMGGLKVSNLAFGGNKMSVTRKDQQAVEVWQGSTRKF